MFHRPRERRAPAASQSIPSTLCQPPWHSFSRPELHPAETASPPTEYPQGRQRRAAPMRTLLNFAVPVTCGPVNPRVVPLASCRPRSRDLQIDLCVAFGRRLQGGSPNMRATRHRLRNLAHFPRPRYDSRHDSPIPAPSPPRPARGLKGTAPTPHARHPEIACSPHSSRPLNHGPSHSPISIPGSHHKRNHLRPDLALLAAEARCNSTNSPRPSSTGFAAAPFRSILTFPLNLPLAARSSGRFCFARCTRTASALAGTSSAVRRSP